MKSLKRSASDAFGSSDALQARAEGSKNHSLGEEENEGDAQPSTKLISKIQAIELLEKLVQFAPKEYSEGSAVPERNAFATKNPEIAEIKLTTQFKLRYLCRRFRNIVHSRIPLVLNCFVNKDDSYGLFISDRMGIRQSRDKTLDQLAELNFGFAASEEMCGGGKLATSMAASIRSLKLSIPNFCFSDEPIRTPHAQFISIPALLCRLTETVPLPCRLFLDLQSVNDNTHKCFVKDLDSPLTHLCPSLALEELQFRTSQHHGLNSANPLDESRTLKYFLEFGHHSLVKLNVNVFTLMPLFAPTNDGTSTLPEDWTCVTLRTLSLVMLPVVLGYNVGDENNRAAFVAFCAKLPRIFPNLSKIELSFANRFFCFAPLPQTGLDSFVRRLSDR